MKIQVDLPLIGTYYTDTKKGAPTDSVRPLPLPFAVNYESQLVSLDVEAGVGTYELRIEDDGGVEYPQALRDAISAWAEQTIEQKRADIIATKTTPVEGPTAKKAEVVRLGNVDAPFIKRRELDGR